MNQVSSGKHTTESLSARAGIEQETMLLNEVVNYGREAARGILAGTFKSSESNALLGAGRLLTSVVKQHMSNRVGRSRLLAQEARVLENEHSGHAEDARTN